MRTLEPLGWDIEIAEEFPDNEEDRDWFTVEPSMGITCAALAISDTDEVWWEAGARDKLFQYRYLPSMTQDIAKDMARHLEQVTRHGHLLVTWNGAGFDFPVLARECNDPAYTRMLAEIALNHCDLGFAMMCSHGYMVGLDTAAKALGLPGKTEGMSGGLAPILWNPVERELSDKERLAIHKLGVEPGSDEARQLCITYVRQDAATTRQVYEALLKERTLVWRTRTGRLTRQPWSPFVVDGHIATCREAMTLALPDTSWMTHARSRLDYIGWALDALGIPR